MKKFAIAIIGLLAVSTVFSFGCGSTEKDDNRKDKQIIQSETEENTQPKKFSREPHLRRNNGFILHMPNHTNKPEYNYPRIPR